MIGTALGLLLAQIGTDAIKLLTPANVPNLEHVAVEGNVVWFAVAGGAFTILLFGLVPALRGRSLYVARLTPDGRGVSSVEQLFENKHGRLRDVFVGPDGAVYIATSNLDGRARGVGPFENDDKVLRITPVTRRD